ncbi:hypothetical protein FB639_000227 [Coemansia asiatica]|nr:hypothetical protein FB639_000227 [Coemansia asiatica]
MDAKTVRSLLSELDLERYTAAATEKETKDEVWPPELEEVFLTAAKLFAPVGQRKYQLDSKEPGSRSTELCGRNDIISRYIFMKTGKYRTRKQVSSHIQVWVHCKRPPSSHSVDIHTFTELQKLFKDHYTRSSMEVQGSVKKRIRRVVSTSNVEALKKLASSGSHALGISNSSPIARSLAGTPVNPRKHGMAGLSGQASKRARRVVSEFPHAHSHSLLESIAGSGSNFGCASSDNSGFMTHSPAMTESNGYSLWTPNSYRQTHSQLSIFSHPNSTPHPLFQPQASAEVAAGSVFAQSALNLGLGLHNHQSMQELSTAVLSSTTPVPSLTAATMAAIAAVDNVFGSTAAHPVGFSANVPQPASDIPAGVFPLRTSMPVPTPSHIMSAFAASVEPSAYSDRVNCFISSQPDFERPEALSDIPLSSDGIQSFAEALNQYCHCTDDTEMAILSTVDQSAISNNSSNSSSKNSNARAVTDENVPPVAKKPVNSNEQHSSDCNRSLVKASATDSANFIQKETCPSTSAHSSSTAFFAANGNAEPKCTAEALHQGARRENGLREFFKYIRSSPSGTHSTRSISRDSDTTAGCGSSPLLPPHWVSTAMPMAVDAHAVTTSSEVADAICLYTAPTDIGCALNPVSDWISSLQGMLDSNYAEQCIFQEGQLRNNSFPFLDPGIVGARNASTNNDIDVGLDNGSAANGGGHGSATGTAHDGLYAELFEYLRNTS